LTRLCKEAMETRSNTMMIMVDLDYFKAVNDKYGHAVGDEVLLGASKIVAERIRGKGKAYRFGGEEFAVLLQNYTTAEGITLAEIIRKQIEASVLSEKNLKVTASFGLAGIPEHAQSSEEIVRAADTALYQAKELGRNLVRVFGEQKPVQRDQAPERKAAVPGGWSSDDQERIRVSYFTGRQPECPKDGASIRILREFHEIGRKTPTILVMCPVCGLQEMIHGLS
jgi:diguanylate cyclase (GGDEF)-like protein